MDVISRFKCIFSFAHTETHTLCTTYAHPVRLMHKPHQIVFAASSEIISVVVAVCPAHVIKPTETETKDNIVYVTVH